MKKLLFIVFTLGVLILSSCKKDTKEPVTPVVNPPVATIATTLNITALQICSGQNQLSPLPKCSIIFSYDKAQSDTLPDGLFKVFTDSTGKYTFIGKEPRIYYYRAVGYMSTGNCNNKFFIKTGTFELYKDYPTEFQLMVN